MGYPHLGTDCGQYHDLVRDFHGDGKRPLIATLCGSTRFREKFEDVIYDLTLEGIIAVPPGVWVRSDPAFADLPNPEEEKAKLDELHLRKIDLSDMIFVVNVDGYVGESTAREIAYAYEHHKRVMYLEYEGEDVYAPRLTKPDGDQMLG